VAPALGSKIFRCIELKAEHTIYVFFALPIQDTFINHVLLAKERHATPPECGEQVPTPVPGARGGSVPAAAAGPASRLLAVRCTPTSKCSGPVQGSGPANTHTAVYAVRKEKKEGSKRAKTTSFITRTRGSHEGSSRGRRGRSSARF
jgi:hypothetical protein